MDLFNNFSQQQQGNGGGRPFQYDGLQPSTQQSAISPFLSMLPSAGMSLYNNQRPNQFQNGYHQLNDQQIKMGMARKPEPKPFQKVMDAYGFGQGQGQGGPFNGQGAPGQIMFRNGRLEYEMNQ